MTLAGLDSVAMVTGQSHLNYCTITESKCVSYVVVFLPVNGQTFIYYGVLHFK